MLFVLFFSLFAGVLFGQTPKASESYVAKAGGIFISEEEFIQRFELLPAFGRHRESQLESAKLELLYSMIAEKLLAQEAVARGLDKDSLFRQAFFEVRKMLSRDELYRMEIVQKVDVTLGEIAEGIGRALRQLLVSYIYFNTEESAMFVRSHMRDRRDFDLLRIDSSMNAIRDTATVIWGDADRAIEEIAYSMKKNEISTVVRAGNGFYILALTGLQRNNTYASMQPDVLHDRVTKILRSRKELARLNLFVAEALEGKIGYSLPRTLKTLARELERKCKTANDTLVSLTPEVVLEMRARCKPWLADTFAVVGNAVWSLGEVLDRLSGRGFTVHCGDTMSVSYHLNTQVKIMVQQELLAQEALGRRLDEIPSVHKRLETWRQYYLSMLMKEYAKRNVTVSDPEVYSYLTSLDRLTKVPQVQVRELRTKTLDEMKEALDQLEKGVTFARVIQQWSSDSAAKNHEGVSDFFPITEHRPVGEIAWQMDVGQRFGPISVPEGVFFFELLAKRSESAASDTSAIRAKQNAKAEVLRMKQKRTLDVFLSQAAEERGFTIFQDRLKGIKVTPIPMMTFRILGFGGRMFAVPFVDKQIDWLGIEPPSAKILP